MDRAVHTWPATTGASRYSALAPSPSTHNPRRRQLDTADGDGADDGSGLPFDVMLRIAAAFAVPDLWTASLVCRSWRDALRPLREAMGMLRLGKRFKHGRGGVPADRGKALGFFLEGVVRGSTAAMVDAGLVYWEMGKREEAIGLYRRAAELGDPSGQCNLGISYLQVEPSKPEEAVKQFQLAASAGHTRAQYNLALCLHQGRGVQCNLPKAAKWYLKAAESGNERAMYSTFLCYSLGQGLVLDEQLAKKWLRRAADHGHRKAQYEHGLRLFTTGELAMSLVYLELATRAGEPAAAHVRDAASQMISADSRTWAIATADKWQLQLPSHRGGGLLI